MNPFRYLSQNIFVVVFLFSMGFAACTQNPQISMEVEPTPVRVIYETDFTFDVDDVGALAVLHALADHGEAEILAISYNEVQSRAADAIDAINSWYRRGDIPIGLYDKPLAEPDYFHSFYIDELAGMRNDITDNLVDTSLNIYKQVLSEQPDNSVTIISVGFLNNLYDLLIEEPALVAQKVDKLVLMGGVYYDEFNFVRHDLVEQTQYVLENWPTPVIVSQEGVYIKTGAALENTPKDNPVRHAYYAWFDNTFQDRSSWDQVAVLYGVRDSSIYFDEVDTGNGQLSNGYQWKMEPGHRMYLVHKLSTTEMAKIIETLMIQPPVHALAGSLEP